MPTPSAQRPEAQQLPVADAIVSAADMQLQVGSQMIDWADFWAQYDADYELQPALRKPVGSAFRPITLAGGYL